jgi:lipopolysaccharide export LptBFGC system permease protein LptF
MQNDFTPFSSVFAMIAAFAAFVLGVFFFFICPAAEILSRSLENSHPDTAPSSVVERGELRRRM